MPTPSFMDYQLDQYGAPKRPQQSGSTLGAGTNTSQAVMPNGNPPMASMASGEPTPAATQPAQPSGPPLGAGGPAPASQPTPTAQQQPQQAQSQQSSSTPPRPNGTPSDWVWVGEANGGWLPPSHPLSQGVVAAQAGNNNQPTQPQANTLNYVPANPTTIPPGQPGTINPQGVYTPSGNVPQFNAPDMSGLQNTQMSQLQNLLNSGGSMNPQVVNQMKGAQRDASALMNQQNLGALQSQMAGRGVDVSQGYGVGQQRQLQSDSTANLLNQYRGIDMGAAGQNRQDLLNALQASGQYQNQLFGQASQGFQNNLAGYMGNQSNLQAGAASAQNAINSGNQNNQFNAQLGQNMTLAQMQQALQQQQMAQQNNQFNSQLGQQGQQFQQTFGLNTQQFDWTKQYDLMQNALQYAQLGQNNNQFNSNLAFNYQNMYGNQNGNNNQLLYNAIFHPPPA